MADPDPDLLLGILGRHGEMQLCHRVVVYGAADPEMVPGLKHQWSCAGAWKLGCSMGIIEAMHRIGQIFGYFWGNFDWTTKCIEHTATATVGYNLYKAWKGSCEL